MTNPFKVGLTIEELEEYLLHLYNAITSLYFTYDSLELTDFYEKNFNKWVKRKRPDIYEKLTVKSDKLRSISSEETKINEE